MVRNKCCLCHISSVHSDLPVPGIDVPKLILLRFHQRVDWPIPFGEWRAILNGNGDDTMIVCAKPTTPFFLKDENNFYGSFCRRRFNIHRAVYLIKCFFFLALLACPSSIRSSDSRRGAWPVQTGAMFCDGEILFMNVSHGLIDLHHLHKRRTLFGIHLIESNFFGPVLFQSRTIFPGYFVVPSELLFFLFGLLVPLCYVNLLALIGSQPEFLSFMRFIVVQICSSALWPIDSTNLP